MTQEYTLTEMIESISKFFSKKKFFPEEYSDVLYNVRVPLFCVKRKKNKKDGEIVEQVVVDIITETHIRKGNTFG